MQHYLGNFPATPSKPALDNIVGTLGEKMEVQFVCKNQSMTPEGVKYDVEWWAMNLDRQREKIQTENMIDLPHTLSETLLPKGLNVDVSITFNYLFPNM